jgi:hypothetical protein
VAVDDADRVIGEQGVGPAGLGQVSADVPVGLGQGERGRGNVVAELDPLVEGRHVTDAKPAPQRGLADQQDRQQRPGIKTAVGEHAHGLELVVRHQV